MNVESMDLCEYKIGKSRAAEQQHKSKMKGKYLKLPAKKSGTVLEASKCLNHHIVEIFQGCVTYVHCNPSELNNPIKGSTVNEVLHHLLTDPTVTKLSVTTVEEMLDIIETEVPVSIKTQCALISDCMDDFLKEAAFSMETKERHIASYDRMCNILQNRMTELEYHINDVVTKLHAVCKAMLSNSFILQAKWTKLWHSIFGMVTNRYQVECKHEKNKFRPYICDKGQRTMQSILCEAPKERKDADSSESEFEESQSSTVTSPCWKLVAAPALVCEIEQEDAYITRSFVVEIKTSRTLPSDTAFDVTNTESATGKSTENDASGKSKSRKNAGGCDSSSEPASKRQKLEGKQERSRLDPLKTQHFMELLLQMRDERNDMLDLYERHLKAFGFYIVMNKVFITSLTAHRNHQDMSHMNTACFIAEDKSENYKTHFKNGKRFLMKSTDFLNLFNPIHFRALLLYVQFLVWHEYRHIQ